MWRKRNTQSIISSNWLQSSPHTTHWAPRFNKVQNYLFFARRNFFFRFHSRTSLCARLPFVIKRQHMNTVHVVLRLRFIINQLFLHHLFRHTTFEDARWVPCGDGGGGGDTCTRVAATTFSFGHKLIDYSSMFGGWFSPWEYNFISFSIQLKSILFCGSAAATAMI